MGKKTRQGFKKERKESKRKKRKGERK